MIAETKPGKSALRSSTPEEYNVSLSSVNGMAESDLTAAAAAERLHISLNFLIKTLDEAAMPYHLIDGQRYVKQNDLREYQARLKAERKKALDELVRYSEEIGLYEVEDQIRLEPK